MPPPTTASFSVAMSAHSAANKVGQINCWSISVTATTATSPSGVLVTPRLTEPQPLRGAFDYAYFTIKNTTPSSLNNVTLTGTLPDSMSDFRENPAAFPSTCDVNVTTFTCTWSSVASGDTVFGGFVAKVGNPKKGKVCLDGTVTATGISAVKASTCFTVAAYPAPDAGTGYDIGNIAHNIALQDQHGHLVALSSFAGKYVLLQFTAAWCGPSNLEVPQDRDEIAALNDSNAMGVEVVYLTVMLDGPSVNVPSTQVNAANWADHFDLTTPVLWTANDATLTARQEFNSYVFQNGQPEPGVPTSVFIRPNGEIFGFRLGVEPSGATTDRFLNDLP